ncbi:ZIP family metal transporter [Aquabacterium soli]|jgi:zinc and cadmium transporter|uniref:ZIP family metal transporter n=1 Tax=Aquabacterium soli TaxID=2493092 RepID=A0A3R8S4M3_9BURK|nr:ZIP family metal transporter [Aquabacterium soli]RRS02307.1 ZIP family metal transporter [Aquabacterium soli]
MTLVYILAATFLGGVVSVMLAAALSAPLLGLIVRHLVSLSTGVLLGTALLHVLPEAFETGAPPDALFLTLLGGLMFFFLLEKAELYRHGHHHEHDHHHHHHGFDAEQAGRGGFSVLVGDSIHNFCDGILIAGAFIASPELGLVTAMAIIAHEIPQEVGDYIVLINAGFTKTRALVYNAISGTAAMVGGVVGYVVIGPWQHYLPYMMVVAASSFVYVAVADLIPQLQRRLSWRQTAAQLFWLLAGLVFIGVIAQSMHGHDHGHERGDHEHGAEAGQVHAH